MNAKPRPGLLGPLPVHTLHGHTDDEVRALWEQQRRASYVPGTSRMVQLGRDACAWVLHPDDRAAGMSRIPAYRPKRGRR